MTGRVSDGLSAVCSISIRAVYVRKQGWSMWEWRHSNLWRRNEAEGGGIEGTLASGYIHKHAK
jgi:hypothetical protein